MEQEVVLYNVNEGIARKVFSILETFNLGRRGDTGYYAICVATAYRTSYALWRIFADTAIPPLYIRNLAINFDDAAQRAMEYLHNCNIRLEVRDNTFFEPYYASSDDIIPFGKYRGKRLAEVYYIDPHYVLWLANKYEPHSRRDERLVEIAKGFACIYMETVIHKKRLPAVSRYVGKPGEKLLDLQLTVLNVRLQTDTYKPDYFVDQNVLAVDVDGNRYTFLVKAAARSLAPDMLSCYSRKIALQEQLNIHSAKVLSHYESRGVRYTRIGFVKLK